ncbi:phenylacetate--CoA ligase [Nitratireductor mangrovi]|uniref:Phenylacetate--CoA ligase n=1 Tax=Nitratireductor mangrovi TaxID=2599600 RepID=A0A5B8KYB3_9HYPH|nr:phenylacetate--CoA ligase [Nitratireductor mangrovi]QDZ00569.1 phenylacetate--CoA ligase [Nitratireductor mangrovi]
MSTDRFARLRDIHHRAHDLAPAIRAILDGAGVAPSALDGSEALARIPVFKKERMIDLQRERPPFGGFLAAEESDIERIFVSPGPINEPQIRGESDHFGFAGAFAAAGIGRGDRVLNTWSYHLVPAGLALDDGLRATGAAVIPSGTGNSEMQAKLVLDLDVTCICAATAFFVTLAETIEAMGRSLPEQWSVKSALLGGEFGDWMGKRKRLEARYGIRTFSVYATADFGIIGFESDGEEGYEIHQDRIVQICDPVSGAPLPPGEPGEIVVTTLNAGWPLIRFGTGDVAIARSLHADGTVARISMLQGRVGQAVKAREIFVYPRQLEDLAISVPGLARAQAVVARPGHREEITLNLVTAEGADVDAIRRLAADRFRELSRLKADHVEVLAAIPDDAPLVVDRKDVG